MENRETHQMANRVDFKRKRQIFLATLVMVALLTNGCTPKPAAIRWVGQTMGTTYHITAMSPSVEDAMVRRLQSGVDSVLQSINRQMNLYSPESEISRFNAYQGVDCFPISSHFEAVMRDAQKVWEVSRGAFDVTIAPLVALWGFSPRGVLREIIHGEEIYAALDNVGMEKLQIGDGCIAKRYGAVEIDLNAIAKGYDVDAVAAYLKRKGYDNTLVEIGGEVVVTGLKHRRK